MSNVHFKVIVPFYNVEKWVKYCVRSIKKQDYKNFQCILMDDISTDQSADFVAKEIEGDDRFILIRNSDKALALKNIYDAINISKPDDEDVIVTVDGDDWLANSNVLGYLSDFYKKHKCWMTYGSYAEYPTNVRGKFSKQIPPEWIKNRTLRDSPWLASHLRTFKYKLWKKIKKQDFLDSDGNFYKMAWDLSFMFPMLEMAGEKSRHISEILYTYNVDNPINDHKVDNRYQIRLEREIRSKPPYKTLEDEEDDYM